MGLLLYTFLHTFLHPYVNKLLRGAMLKKLVSVLKYFFLQSGGMGWGGGRE